MGIVDESLILVEDHFFLEVKNSITARLILIFR